MRRIFNDGQEIVYTDLNKITKSVYNTLFDKVLFRMLLSKENAFFQGSFLATYVSATSISVAAGVGFLSDAAQVSPEPKKQLLYRPSASTQTLAAAHATLDRIDILCVRFAETDEITESRRFKNLSTSVVTSENMVVQKDELADLLIVTGTPSGSPAAPATPSGYLRIASMTVPAATGMTGSGNVIDERALMPVGGKTTLDTTAFTRLTDGAAITLDTLMGEIDSILTTGNLPYTDLDLYDSPGAEPPAPAVGKKRFFSRNDLLYQKTSAGVTTQIGQTDADTSSVVTGNTTMQSGYAYQTNSASLITMTLPATAVVGARFKIYGRGAGGWKVAVNSGQTISMGAKTQTYGVAIALKSKYQFDCVEIVCTVADTTFIVADFSGSPSVEGNYWGDGSDGAGLIAANTNLTATTDGDIIVKHYTSLTINSSYTLTTNNRCRGLWIYVDGDCTINGTLTMSSRGASHNPTGTPSTGIRFPRFKTGGSDTFAGPDIGTDVGTALFSKESAQGAISANGKIYTIVKVGGAGGAASNGAGNVGGTITDGVGGGGSGGSNFGPVQGGGGTAGTCFSGGSAGGGTQYDPFGSGGGASSFGGAGGAGAPASVPSTDGGGGGAGNPGGNGGSGNSPGGAGGAGGSGTGGLLVLMVRGNLTIGSGAVISSNGANGGYGGSGGASPDGGGGGGSGGGRIIVLYAGTLSNSGTIQANGGSGGSGAGGAGGAGAQTIEQILP